MFFVTLLLKKIKHIKAKIIYFLSLTIMLLVFFGYYPRYNKTNTQAMITWDAAGYYMYLPAIFIYKDIKKCAFADEIIRKYQPSPVFDLAFIHKKSGNYVMKYPIGQAIQFSPFFFIAHLWAKNSDKYPPDGFSFPYQLLIGLSALFYALIGFYFCNKVLRLYFSNYIAALTTFLLLLGSNYLNYALIDCAMTHNNLFTIYSILIYTSILFYNKPTFFKAFLIGLLVGFAALTRPTELIAFIIPIGWNLNFLDKNAIFKRLNFFQNNFKKIALAVLTCSIVGFIQLAYWKYASGDWFVYSYEDQGFSWLRPHLINGFISYKSGWLTYSPLMVFSLIGFVFLYKQNKNVFWTALLFSSIFIYITFAWDIWWYGGSIGQRAMVQAYPVLALPFAAFLKWLLKRKLYLKISTGILISFFCYLSLWFIHQAHLGGMLHVGQMNRTYYWKTLGTLKKDINHLKILDTNEYFEGERKNIKQIYFNDFNDLNDNFCIGQNKTKAICMDKKTNASPVFKISPESKNYKWLRASAEFKIEAKEWNIWNQAQFVVHYKKQAETVKNKSIRLHRLLNDGDYKIIFFDIKKPKQSFDAIEISFHNFESDKSISIDNLKVESFD